ncbi:MAG: TIGR00270 family protein [DPANN group archaeon]|nr:TIGR00270 family protein [DPANN group archaeon]
MLDCEICGSAPASAKASFDGVILNVCSGCAATGKIIEQPKPAARQPVLQYIAPESGETVTENFGKIISSARQQMGLKQDELASKLNEKLSVIQAAEQGKRLDLGLARKVEKFLKIKIIEDET